MEDSYSLGDDFRFGTRCHPPNPNLIDMRRPINYAVAPGCPDGDCKGYTVVQTSSTTNGEVGKD